MCPEEVRGVLDALSKLYPEATAELRFSNPYETLVATMLAAQCTDRRVNQVTARLFPAYPDAASMARLSPEELEPWIRECGLYHTKARNIVAASRAICEKHGGRVPSTREELQALPGVGVKTAGVVLLAAFGEEQIPVDTHVFRVANRIGLCAEPTAEKTEQALRAVLPAGELSHSHHLLIWHGRRCCAARKSACERCPLREKWCLYAQNEREGARA